MNYHFEEVQNLKFVVYDVDDRKQVDDVSRHDFIGEIQCSLADIITAGHQYRGRLRNKGGLEWTLLQHSCFYTVQMLCMVIVV